MDLLCKALYEMPHVTLWLVTIAGGLVGLRYLLTKLVTFLDEAISANWKAAQIVFVILGLFGVCFSISLFTVSAGPDSDNGITLGTISLIVSTGFLLAPLATPPKVATKD